MKKLSISTFPLIAVLVLASVMTYAQTNKFKVDVSKFNNEKSVAINEKAINTFNKMYTDAFHIIWSRDNEDNNCVYFERKGKKTRATFDNKGRLIAEITTYQEEYLPQEVLSLIKETYMRKSIFGITEVHCMNKIAYVVDLEDKTSWLKVKVIEGSIEEETEMLKG